MDDNDDMDYFGNWGDCTTPQIQITSDNNPTISFSYNYEDSGLALYQWDNNSWNENNLDSDSWQGMDDIGSWAGDMQMKLNNQNIPVITWICKIGDRFENDYSNICITKYENQWQKMNDEPGYDMVYASSNGNNYIADIGIDITD
jgi:hypothetical protein